MILFVRVNCYVCMFLVLGLLEFGGIIIGKLLESLMRILFRVYVLLILLLKNEVFGDFLCRSIDRDNSSKIVERSFFVIGFFI